MKWALIPLLWVIWANVGMAQNLAGLARVNPDESQIVRSWGGDTKVTLGLSQAVPYKVYAQNNPNRIIIDFQVVVFDGLGDENLLRSRHIAQVNYGAITSQLSRMVLVLNEPLRVSQAVMNPDGFEMVLVPVTQAAFDETASQPDEVAKPLPIPTQAKGRPTGDRKWIIAIDPGHGGIDPGADGGRRSEADLMLLTAFELQDRLRTSGVFDAFMTRTDDSFVGLESRMSRARAGNADVFISLHADAVVEGVAVGSTVYTLSARAGSQADAKLAARHNSADILAGVNLSGQGDEIATVLLDLVRRETAPRAQTLAEAIISGLHDVGAPVNSKPLRKGDFAVLRAADIPSVLVELGFLSSASDRERLNTPAGRAQVIDGITNALLTWTVKDAAAAALIRQ